jgi:hypothetical protein
MESDLKGLKDAFEKMQKDGFKIEDPLKWGFFFIDRDKDKLVQVFEELKDHDYKLESLRKNGGGEWMLTVSKLDTLTPEKLHKRNIAFNELADYCSVSLYDGWDVERV